jgi:chitinase
MSTHADALTDWMHHQKSGIRCGMTVIIATHIAISRKKMSHLNLFILITLSLTGFRLIANPINGNDTLQNQAMGENVCLTMKNESGEITFSICSDSEDQYWKFVKSTPGYFYIKNNAAPDKCLRTLSDGKTVTLGSCQGDGYTSMRMWETVQLDTKSIAIKNKYNNDLGRHHQLVADNNKIQMSGDSGELNSKWIYNGEIPPPKNPFTGVKKILLMATYFNDTQPVDPAPIKKAVFGNGDDYASLQHYLALSSRGKLTIDGLLLSDVNIGDRPSSCNSSDLLTRARAAAREQGVEPNDFDFLFVDISRTTVCKWEGLASKPGNWIISNGVGHKYWMWSHEFGHNIGLGHTTTLQSCPVENGVVQINSSCINKAGVDLTDTMGGGGSRLYPVNYQFFADWLDGNNMPIIKDAGIYNLKPLWLSESHQGYRIMRSDGSTLILEFRQPQQGFENWNADSPFVNGLIIRIAKHSGSTLTNTLVDATPNSAQGMNDAPLMPGKSLYDSLSGKLITLISVDSDGASIQIDDVN